MRAVALAALCSFALGACTHTRVHLFTAGLDDSQIARVSSDLRRHGYRVLPSELDPPPLEGPTVIYSPGHRETERVLGLLDRIRELGYPMADLAVVAKGNHAYTGNNVGLYLAEGSAGRSQAPYAYHIDIEMPGRCGSQSADLTFEAGGAFVLRRGDGPGVRGTWDSTEAGLQVRYGGQVDLMGVQREVQLNAYGRTIITRVAHRQGAGALADCQFRISAFEDVPSPS